MAACEVEEDQGLDLEQPEEDELEPPERASFFAEGERGDELACERIWLLYEKASRERFGGPKWSVIGRPVRQVAEGAAMFERRAPREGVRMVMGEQPKKRGAMLELVRERVAAWTKKRGAAPTAAELFEDIGEDLGVSVSNVRMACKRAGIELAGKGVVQETGGGERRTKKRGPRLHVTKANGCVQAPSDEAHPSGGTSAYLAIMALQADRAKVAAQLEAIDSVIARLRA